MLNPRGPLARVDLLFAAKGRYLATLNQFGEMMPEGNKQRIAKLIASRGLTSRREAEKWIVNGRVRLNGKVLLDPATNVDPAHDEVVVDGEVLPKEENHLYLAVNKPKGVLSTFQKDREWGRTLEGVVPHDRRLFTAGRLDRDSTGLLLLTTDGDWANHVMHPRYEKEKEYLVRFKKARPTPAARRIAHATFTEDGKEFGLDKVVVDGSYLRIILHQGRKRHIRRVAEAAGLEVSELIRVRIGPVELGSLKQGRWRKLSGQEIHELGKR